MVLQGRVVRVKSRSSLALGFLQLSEGILVALQSPLGILQPLIVVFFDGLPRHRFVVRVGLGLVIEFSQSFDFLLLLRDLLFLVVYFPLSIRDLPGHFIVVSEGLGVGLLIGC